MFNWLKKLKEKREKRKQEKELEEHYKKKIEELRKKDPYTYD